MASIYYPAFVHEFRNLKLESLIKDLHKMTPDELKIIKKEINSLLAVDEEKNSHV